MTVLGYQSIPIKDLDPQIYLPEIRHLPYFLLVVASVILRRLLTAWLQRRV